jgi:hypothetical protein
MTAPPSSGMKKKTEKKQKKKIELHKAGSAHCEYVWHDGARIQNKR